MVYPNSLNKTIEYLQTLPGIGEKSAERMALALLEKEEEDVRGLSKAIVDLKTKLKKCLVCGNLTEDEDICPICSSKTRNKNLICVLEDTKSLFALEKVGQFSGVYHVLGGLISPLDNIGPENINIKGLVERVEKLNNPEIIIALKSSLEGDTTTMYIKKIFENKNVEISRLSYGLPMNAEIDYLDEITLVRALEDRKIISK